MRFLLLAVVMACAAVDALKGAFLGQALGVVFASLHLSALCAGSLRPAVLARLALAALCVAGVGHDFDLVALRELGLLLAAFSALAALFSLKPLLRDRLRLPAGFLLAAYLLANAAALPLIGDLVLARPQRIGYIRSGVWADADDKGAGANIETGYSSSRLIRNLGAEVLDADRGLADLRSFGTLVLFTPTKPLAAGDIDRICGWVRAGGRLVVIVDHTDLFGHARVANQVLASFGVAAGYDAIVPRGEQYVYYLGPGGRLAGLTACSLRGNGDPIYAAIGFSESVDYGGESFFSDLSATEGDKAGVHCVGLRSTCGLGQVVVFGDSTFFANFAISRHASVAALQGLTAPCPGYPVHDIALIACLLLVLPLRAGILSAGACLLLIVGAKLRPSVRPAGDAAQADAFVLLGDTDLTDRESGPLAALVASHYAYADRPVIWGATNPGSGELSAMGTLLRPGSATCGRSGLLSGLGADLAGPFEALMRGRDVRSVAHFGTIWFDDGVGALREELFRSFWGRREFSLGISGEETMRFSELNGRRLEQPVEVKVRWLSCGDGWALLGEGYVGRWVDGPKAFLLRRSWQINGMHVDTTVLGRRVR